MARRNHRTAIHLAYALLAISVTVPAQSPSALAQGVSPQQIIDALKRRPINVNVPRTRSLTETERPLLNMPSQEEQQFIKSLRNRTRSLTLTERERVSSIAQEQNAPNIDLEIYFDYNSAAITRKAEPDLQSLARALTSEELAGATIVLSGHTDAKGSDSYNQVLSERRAESVRRYLISKFGVPAGGLSTAGYGKQQLKNSESPFAAENRRVHLVNMPETTEARN